MQRCKSALVAVTAQVFVANPNKTQEITELLQHNKDKLLRYLGDFHTDKGGSPSCQHCTLFNHWCRVTTCSRHHFLVMKSCTCCLRAVRWTVLRWHALLLSCLKVVEVWCLAIITDGMHVLAYFCQSLRVDRWHGRL